MKVKKDSIVIVIWYMVVACFIGYSLFLGASNYYMEQEHIKLLKQDLKLKQEHIELLRDKK